MEYKSVVEMQSLKSQEIFIKEVHGKELTNLITDRTNSLHGADSFLSHLVEKLPGICGYRRIISFSTRACHWLLYS
jgi:hypothetical protein